MVMADMEKAGAAAPAGADTGERGTDAIIVAGTYQ